MFKVFMSNIVNFIYVFLPILSFSQHLVNNGAAIVIQQGAYFIVQGDFINNPDDSPVHTQPDSGYIDIDGIMVVGGQWTNNSDVNHVFKNIEATPNGTVHLNGNMTQHIQGTNSTEFENLYISNYTKRLITDNNVVNGVLTVNAVLNLNARTLIINNPAPEAIRYISKYIYAETLPSNGYGIIRWNIGNNTGTYQIPFGSSHSYNNDLNLVVKVKTPGIPSNGYINFSTYPTTCFNEPYPIGVPSFFEYDYDATVDRYWYINPNYSLKPTVDIAFKYSDYDISPNCNLALNEENLKGIRYNNLKNTWADKNPIGKSNKFENMVVVPDVDNDNFFDNWTLTTHGSDFVIWIPNAFKPDENERNDLWGPSGYDLTGCKLDLFIYSRWGEVIFESHDFNHQWDGRINGGEIAPLGVYPYQIFITDAKGNRYEYFGHVTLLK